MNANEILFEISRDKSGILTSAKIIMPTWSRVGEDGNVYIQIPLLGEISTFATNEEDAEIAITEAFECFCILAEKQGKGIERELELLGWSRVEKKNAVKHHALLNIKSPTPVINNLTKTGDGMAVIFQPHKPQMAFA